jgi:exonuclease SbcC
MPHLKEAFQARIEVNKTQQGSHIRLLTWLGLTVTIAV